MVPETSLVSVIMATHNGSRFIKEAIDSVLKQRFEDYELLIVDNASTDDTSKILSQYNQPSIRVISNADNQGLTRSLNRGLSMARGKYVARIDDDDIWPEPDKLSRQVDFLQQQGRVGLVGTQNIVIDVKGKELYRLHYGIKDGAIRRQMLGRNQFPHSSVLIRKSALDEVGFYDESFRYAQDFELWLRIGLKYELANLEDVYIKQRVNPHGVTSRKNMQQFLSFLKIAYKYRNKYPGYWGNMPVYGRELFINLLPKPVFYRMSARLRPFRHPDNHH